MGWGQGFTSEKETQRGPSISYKSGLQVDSIREWAFKRRPVLVLSSIWGGALICAFRRLYGKPKVHTNRFD